MLEHVLLVTLVVLAVGLAYRQGKIEPQLASLQHDVETLWEAMGETSYAEPDEEDAEL